ncbi:MAG: DMT family transporter [Cyanobacteria bacterium J06627_32]
MRKDPAAINPAFFPGMLVLSRALSAARPSLISLLIVSGAQLSGGVVHPISFCNVLFIGNFCAALAVGFWFGFGRILREVCRLPPQVVLGLLLNGCLATLLSTLIFLGLRETTVTNAVLLGRLGPVLFALAGAQVLGKKIRRLEWVGFALIAVGVVAIALHTSQFQIGRGDLLILLSTVVFSASALTNQLMVAKKAPLQVVVFSRNFVSSVIFLAIAWRLFGPMHFADAFSGQLWMVMAVYALVVIVAAQFLWYGAVNHLDSQTVGKLTVLSPIFGVGYAFLLRGERPSSIQGVTLVLIILGVAIASFGRARRPASQQDARLEVMTQTTDSVASAP